MIGIIAFKIVCIIVGISRESVGVIVIVDIIVSIIVGMIHIMVGVMIGIIVGV